MAIRAPHLSSSPHRWRLYVVIAVWAVQWIHPHVVFWVIEEECAELVVDVGDGLVLSDVT